ncbi:SMC-Scp complex subunit ScpB [Leptospira brenneri]|uniref:SMC-Scp complex subunit ScpB n=1 Tax=Leptospira brenneri TaxID=2023182 RepID=A0A2M9Y0K8_9LEPT|nr:SMC-Scp complex subunit ScpB [Leptospira brenneri]PJZ45049.1 SMC-Scp complex subunit ScpB [Leptospira brenneri]TGK95177.1 SMC-Scp complex subunit ScpB [Leptospira brenneri]
MEERTYTKGLLEALLFLSSDPIKLSALAKSAGIEKTEARELLDELILDYEEKEGGFLLREIAGGYQFITNQKYSEILAHIFKDKKRETLSRGTLDTLAIIAYKQPITLTELDEIRGVSSRAMVASLMSKKLVKAVGQKEVPGRPTLYGTTNEFLLHFGLSKLTDLPTPVEVKELKFEEFTPESIIVTDETEMNPDFDKSTLPAELQEGSYE